MPAGKVHVFPKAAAKLQSYVLNARKPDEKNARLLEISGMGEVTLFDEDFYVTDVFLLPQSSAGAHTDFDQAKVAEALTTWVAEGRDTEKMKLWWHSHANMGVNWSTTDTDTMSLFNYTDWMLFLVLNARGEMTWRCDVYRPFQIKMDKLPWDIVPVKVDEDAIRAEIEANVEWSKPVVTSLNSSNHGNWSNRRIEYPEEMQKRNTEPWGKNADDDARTITGRFEPAEVGDGEWYRTKNGYFRIWSADQYRQEWTRLTTNEACAFETWLEKLGNDAPLDRDAFEHLQTERAAKVSGKSADELMEGLGIAESADQIRKDRDFEEELFRMLASNDPLLISFSYQPDGTLADAEWFPWYGVKASQRKNARTNWLTEEEYFEDRKKRNIPDLTADEMARFEALNQKVDKALNDVGVLNADLVGMGDDGRFGRGGHL